MLLFLARVSMKQPATGKTTKQSWLDLGVERQESMEEYVSMDIGIISACFFIPEIWVEETNGEPLDGSSADLVTLTDDNVVAELK